MTELKKAINRPASYLSTDWWEWTMNARMDVAAVVRAYIKAQRGYQRWEYLKF